MRSLQYQFEKAYKFQTINSTFLVKQSIFIRLVKNLKCFIRAWGTVFQNRPNWRKLILYISETAIVWYVVSYRHILTSFSSIIQRNYHAHPIGRFSLIENSPDLHHIFLYLQKCRGCSNFYARYTPRIFKSPGNT